MFFALVDRATGQPGGVAALMRITPEAGTIEVGHICLAPAMQRSPAASEMVSLFAAHVFGLGYRRFEWKCNARNIASRRAAQRSGSPMRGCSGRRRWSGAQPRHRLVRDDRRRLALPRSGARRLARGGELDGAGVQRSRLGDRTAPCRVAEDPTLGPAR